jgi:hypothetical protein
MQVRLLSNVKESEMTVSSAAVIMRTMQQLAKKAADAALYTAAGPKKGLLYPNTWFVQTSRSGADCNLVFGRIWNPKDNGWTDYRLHFPSCALPGNSKCKDW